MSYRINLGSDLRVRGELWQMGTAPEKDVVPQTGSLLTGRPAETQLSRTTHKIIIRYRKDVTPDMWMEIQGQRYTILYILDPYLRHETLELFCEVRQQ